MNNNVDNLILEQLKGLRNEVKSMHEYMAEEFQQARARISSLEQSVVGLRRDISQIHEDVANTHQRLDRLDDRVTRIEKRLELTG